MKKGYKSTLILVTAVIVLLAATAAEMVMVFRLTSRQIADSGTSHLETISGDLEETINEAKIRTMSLAIEIYPYLEYRDFLTKYVAGRKAELLEEGGTAFNLYMAGDGYHIIPDFDEPADYDVYKRSWYTGAVANDGQPYVTDPYVDAYTGNICYTVSVMLNDGVSVVAIDYTMESIQEHISDMYHDGSRSAIIVTEEGIIAGCNNESLVGKNLIHELPEYAGIFSLAKAGTGTVTVKQRGDDLFATRSGFGWFLIVVENSWSLYRSSYIQIFAMAIISLVIFTVMLFMYFSSAKKTKQATDALAYREEYLEGLSKRLRDPLRSINSAAELGGEDTVRSAGRKLSEILTELNNKLGAQKAVSEAAQAKKRHDKEVAISRHYRATILGALVVVMVITSYINIAATFRYGRGQLQKAATNSDHQLSEWLDTQKSILDMFSSMVSVNPRMLDNYESTIKYFDSISKQYPEISACYLANPELSPTVYMNTGWLPEEGWHVEEREWYKDLMSSEKNWMISSPYYDEQTGLYCVTMAEKVYNSATGEWIGNFGIDFYMDKLADILGSNYSADTYSFIVDAKGEIINHPYGSYQMTENESANIIRTPYKDVEPNGESVKFLKDYDGRFKSLIAVRNPDCNFTVYVISSITSTYGGILIYGLVCTVALILCTVLVYKVMTNLINLQEEANIQLKESAEKAIAADEAKSSFLAQMSHEIRTPINAVLGMNEMILRESRDISIREYALNIQSAGRLLLSLINSILDFSKIEDGKMELILAPYSTATLINDLDTSIRSRAEDKGLELILNIDPGVPSSMKGDDVRLRQIIINLLTNAVKYTEKGSVTLTVTRGKQEDNHIWINVQVADTGIGIKPEDIGSLFESFKRLDEKRNRNIEGTGLGMNIVNKLLGMMDSELEVKSVYGKGSCFSFTLVQEIVDPTPLGKDIHSAELTESLNNGERLYAQDARVLVVDDNEMNIKVAEGLLKLHGIVPDSAPSGYRAIELIAETKVPYDIVFMDHMMPKMDGIETLEKLRKCDLPPEGTVVIALTANAIVGARETYIRAGFDDYLTKPIESRKLEKMLERYLPKEKLSYRQEDAKETEQAQEDSFTIDELTDIQELCGGMNAVAGMSYCMGSREFFLDTLKGFLESDHRAEIGETYERGDLDGLRIAAHSTKSAAAAIGCQLLSEHARIIEFAARDGDKAILDKYTEKLIAEYGDVLTGIEGVLEKYGSKEDTDS